MAVGVKLIPSIVAAGLIAAACVTSIGTATRDVHITNGLGEPVLVYTFDRNPRFAQRVEPGGVWRDTWMYPLTSRDRRKVRVEADDLQGQPVFCADYGYDDLSRLNWRIQLGRTINCPGPPEPSPRV